MTTTSINFARVPLEVGRDIVESMYGNIAGDANPRYIATAGGKSHCTNQMSYVWKMTRIHRESHGMARRLSTRMPTPKSMPGRVFHLTGSWPPADLPYRLYGYRIKKGIMS